MRKRLLGLIVALVVAFGCSPSVATAPATPEEEKAAEQRIKEEAARELKARREEQKNRKPDADN